MASQRQLQIVAASAQAQASRADVTGLYAFSAGARAALAADPGPLLRASAAAGSPMKSALIIKYLLALAGVLGIWFAPTRRPGPACAPCYLAKGEVFCYGK